ncbi:DUF2306 domain-containing protein [Natronohydrobacter thiooxidans]|uniref:DUF2306 domain-containing protein n=1 Tax=Natronohydrobacter thiooxidans TaxID=87172 RepID=UPI0008FF3CED|nr:DUF2306 domain-containing protein [Natronohydrobacter thiooxidans]
MIRLFARPMPFALLLIFASFIPVMMAAVRVLQIPAGWLPEDSLRLSAAPAAHWLHALAGVWFGLLGPVQFVRALRLRFGRLHRVAGRVFVLAGIVMGLSGLGLLMRVESIATPLLDIARAVFSAALIAVLLLGLRAGRTGQRGAHRAWMIRAYALGMGGATVALVMLPLYLITGEALSGLPSDLVFLAWWVIMIALGEWVIRMVSIREFRI